MDSHNDNIPPHSNLSYKTFRGIEWDKKDLSRSLLNGTIIVDSSVVNVSFANADLEAAQFQKSKFTDCSFAIAGIHSVIFSDSVFFNCMFDDSNIIDSLFVRCQLINCSFRGTSVRECIFEDGCLDSCNIENSEFMLNVYRRVRFQNMCFLHTFYYQILIQCSFKNIEFETYLLGYTFGLKKSDLASMHLLLMEHAIDYAIGDIFGNLKALYLQRGMFINIGILQLYLSQAAPDYSILGCISFFEEYIKRNILIKSEELHFFKLIVEELEISGRPLLPVTNILLYQKINALLCEYDNLSISKARTTIISLRNAFHYKYLDFLDELKNAEYSEPNTSVEIKVTYVHKPGIPLSDILSAIAPDQEPVRQIRTESGSFIEWLSATFSISDCLQVFLSLLGIVIPLIVTSKKRSLAQHTPAEPAPISIKYRFNDGTQKVDQSLTISLPKGVGHIKKALIVQSAVAVIIDKAILSSEIHSGYTPDNVKSIKIAAHKNHE